MPAAASHREQCERNVKAYDTLGGEQAVYSFKESDVLRLRDIAAKEIPRALRLDALTL